MLAVFSIGLCAYAQLNEVRGVLTQQVEYEEDWYGYTFTNENNYSVWVEAELWVEDFYNHSPAIITDTKSFTLKRGETYLWRNNLSREIKGHYYVKYKAYKVIE